MFLGYKIPVESENHGHKNLPGERWHLKRAMYQILEELYTTKQLAENQINLRNASEGGSPH